MRITGLFTPSRPPNPRGTLHAPIRFGGVSASTGTVIDFFTASAQPLTDKAAKALLQRGGETGHFTEPQLKQLGQWLLAKPQVLGKLQRSAPTLRVNLAFWENAQFKQAVFLEKVLPEVLKTPDPVPPALLQMATVALSQHLRQNTTHVLRHYRRQGFPLSSPIVLSCLDLAEDKNTSPRLKNHLMTLVGTWPQHAATSTEACHTEELLSEPLTTWLAEQASKMKGPQHVHPWLKIALYHPHMVSGESWGKAYTQATPAQQTKIHHQVLLATTQMGMAEVSEDFWAALPAQSQSKLSTQTSQKLMALPGELTGDLYQDLPKVQTALMETLCFGSPKTLPHIVQLGRRMRSLYPPSTVTSETLLALTSVWKTLLATSETVSPVQTTNKEKQTLLSLAKPYTFKALKQDIQNPSDLAFSEALTQALVFHPASVMPQIDALAKTPQDKVHLYQAILLQVPALSFESTYFKPHPWLLALADTLDQHRRILKAHNPAALDAMDGTIETYLTQGPDTGFLIY